MSFTSRDGGEEAGDLVSSYSISAIFGRLRALDIRERIRRVSTGHAKPGRSRFSKVGNDSHGKSRIFIGKKSEKN
jgi:hypothetical protein